VVLPSEPTLPKPQAKPAPKPQPRPEPVPEAPPEEQDYGDVLDQLRSELGEDAPPAPAPEAPSQLAAVAGSATGVPVSPELAAWIKKVRVHVRRSWVVPPAFEMQSLVTKIAVELDVGGNVVGDPEIERRSGNPWYDENVVRSVRKASPLPAPPKAGRWTFDFHSDRE
jgi:outer membrane biosynthesis protein TonB